jgi:hypothetical protein
LPKITYSGVDFETLENESFPQLKMENTLLVQKLFNELKKSLDVKTSKNNSIVINFRTTSLSLIY